MTTPTGSSSPDNPMPQTLRPAQLIERALSHLGIALSDLADVEMKIFRGETLNDAERRKMEEVDLLIVKLRRSHNGCFRTLKKRGES